MNLDVLDPALFTSGARCNPPDLSNSHQGSLSLQTFANLPRLPNQIGCVITAYPHSYSHPYDPYTPLSPPDGRIPNVLSHVQPYGYYAREQQNIFDSRMENTQQIFDTAQQPTPLYAAFFNQPTTTTGYLTPPQSQESSSNNTTECPEISTRGAVSDLPKFYCGEKDCKVFRTDGLNHNGRYAMAKHYKRDHPHLQFDFHRLVSSHTGQKSNRMLPKRNNNRERRTCSPNAMEDVESHQLQDMPLDPALTSVPAPSFVQYTQREDTNTDTQAPQLNTYASARLPCVLEQPFTHVADLHLPVHELKLKTSTLRRACDAEMFELRKLLLSHHHKTQQCNKDFSSSRKRLFNVWIQKARDYIAWVDGPLDSRFGEAGSCGDIVYEVGFMYFLATRRSYLPRDGVMPNGSILGGHELERRRLLCELRAMELCLDFCQNMSQTCGRFLETKRMFAQQKASARDLRWHPYD